MYDMVLRLINNVNCRIDWTLVIQGITALFTLGLAIIAWTQLR
jgi:hypothetical protein